MAQDGFKVIWRGNYRPKKESGLKTILEPLTAIKESEDKNTMAKTKEKMELYAKICEKAE